MGKLANTIKLTCCGSLLDNKAQLVKDVAALENKTESLIARYDRLTKQLIESKAEYDILKSEFHTASKSTCRAVFNAMYKGEHRYKEQVWANLCLTLSIEV
jgi:hypothetical protein